MPQGNARKSLTIALLLAGFALWYTPVLAGGVLFETLARGERSHHAASKFGVIRERADWVEFWRRHANWQDGAGLDPPDMPKVDFAKQSVLFAVAGTQGGGDVAILEIVDKGYEIVAHVEQRTPRSPKLKGFTHPYHYVTVPRHSGPIRFEFSEIGFQEPIADEIQEKRIEVARLRARLDAYHLEMAEKKGMEGNWSGRGHLSSGMDYDVYARFWRTSSLLQFDANRAGLGIVDVFSAVPYTMDRDTAGIARPSRTYSASPRPSAAIAGDASRANSPVSSGWKRTDASTGPGGRPGKTMTTARKP